MCVVLIFCCVTLHSPEAGPKGLFMRFRVSQFAHETIVHLQGLKDHAVACPCFLEA
jgi:hypothetical protein